MDEPLPRRSGKNAKGSDPPEREFVVVWGDELRVYDLPREGGVAIGRADGSDIRIDHESVSRRHAALHLGESVVIEDLGAANGTFVPGGAGPREPGQTRQLRRLVRERAELGVGENIILGAVGAVVRHASGSKAALANRSETTGAVPRDERMRTVHAQAERAALATINVLVLGETGVGKEVMARTIHAHSPRAHQVFLGINCAAFGEQMLEGELFGYERGAFTGAVEARPGLFEAADGGTVFLDEVGELPLSTQSKLLRVLEDRTVLRLGARKARMIDVRFVAATNRDLESDVHAGSFRRDLFYRLNGISLTIPPLRERPTEIEPLARGFAASACRQLERRALRISDEAMSALSAHAWPGNVRELKNAIDRAAVLCPEDVIRVTDLPAALFQHDGPSLPIEPQAARPAPVAAELDPERFAAQVSALERARIVEALDRSGGNQTEAAKLLGIARRTLISRLEALKLPRPRKRTS